MDYVGMAAVLILAVPVSVYLSVKLGTAAFLRARKYFNDNDLKL